MKKAKTILVLARLYIFKGSDEWQKIADLVNKKMDYWEPFTQGSDPMPLWDGGRAGSEWREMTYWAHPIYLQWRDLPEDHKEVKSALASYNLLSYYNRPRTNKHQSLETDVLEKEWDWTS